MSGESQISGGELRPALAASVSTHQSSAQFAYSIGGIKVGIFATRSSRETFASTGI
jgi:hypothetical protein